MQQAKIIGIFDKLKIWVFKNKTNNAKLTRTFLFRSKHQLSSNASILARSASITGEADGGVSGDSSGEPDEDSCSTSGVLIAAEEVSKKGNQNRPHLMKNKSSQPIFNDKN